MFNNLPTIDILYMWLPQYYTDRPNVINFVSKNDIETKTGNKPRFQFGVNLRSQVSDNTMLFI